jgi:uncharacterized protein YecT (DUF1311 family)
MMLLMALAMMQDVPLEIERRYTPAYLACRARRGVALGECNSAELRVQDALLNKTWVRVMTALPSDERRHALRLLERKWIKDRNRACRALANPDLDADWRGGDVSACLLNATVRRIIWLERQR